MTEYLAGVKVGKEYLYIGADKALCQLHEAYYFIDLTAARSCAISAYHIKRKRSNVVVRPFVREVAVSRRFMDFTWIPESEAEIYG